MHVRVSSKSAKSSTRASYRAHVDCPVCTGPLPFCRRARPKTLLVNLTSKALGLDFGRIQFTPDLMPMTSRVQIFSRQTKTQGGATFGSWKVLFSPICYWLMKSTVSTKDMSSPPSGNARRSGDRRRTNEESTQSIHGLCNSESH